LDKTIEFDLLQAAIKAAVKHKEEEIEKKDAQFSLIKS
jgi:hypothetical protein